MSVNAASGYPQLKDAGFIATAYSDLVNVTYYEECLLPRITTSKFSGKVKDQGDKVIIPTRPVIDVKNYTKGMKLETQNATSIPIELSVDRAKYFRFGLDHIDLKQSYLALNKEYVADGTKRMAIATETDFFADVYAYAHAANQGSAAGVKSGEYSLGTTSAGLQLTATASTGTVLPWLTSIRAVLGEQSAADGKIWVVIPEWARWVLINSDLRKAMDMGDQKSVMRTGFMGTLDGIDIYSSNLLHTASDGTRNCTYVVAGNMDAIAFCAQMTKNRVMEAQDTFGVIYDGLYVYGWKVVKPEGLVTSIVYT